VSGEVPAVERLVALAPERGARRAVLLPVSGAFHSPLLADSAHEFADFLAGFEIGAPSCPVVVNVTGRAVTDAAEIRTALARQLISPVRWVETIRTLRGLGVNRCLEAGPGRVLAGLVRRIERDIEVTPVGTADAVVALRAA
jgi:[acyl-carrier-protein] S-malonyltransferase